MTDLINVIKNFFDLVVDFVTSLVDGLVVFWTALGSFMTNYVGILDFFPTIIASVLLVAVPLVIVLRIVGR